MVKDVQIKRAYDPPARTDGYRVLVDRMWPRGVRKDELHVNEWAKDLAPSTKLRQWFGHDPKRWKQFQERYEWELMDPHSKEEIQHVIDAAKDHKTLTLIYSAKDVEHNQAVVLSRIFARKLSGARRKSIRGATHGKATTRTS